MSSHIPNRMPIVAPVTVGQVSRRLPQPGEIVVRAGSRVEPDDLVAQTLAHPHPVFMQIAEALDTQPRDIGKRVKFQPGAHVDAQQVIAQRGRRKVMTPSAGTIAAVDTETGLLVFAPDPEPVTLSALIRGYVAQVEPHEAVVIETPAAVLTGIFGAGTEQFGVLRLVVTDRHDTITPEMIDARSAYAIIIGGAGITAAALRKAQQEQVRGVIVGSIEASEAQSFLEISDIAAWSRYGQSPHPVTPALLVTEGFGTMPMSEPMFELLTRYDRQEALLDPGMCIADRSQHPRLLIPLPRLQSETQPDLALRIGAVVRLVDQAHLGMIGRVTALQAAGKLPHGGRTATAAVQIGESEQILVAQTALEVIG